MAKRKRPEASNSEPSFESASAKKSKATPAEPWADRITIQAVAGSYDRALHGITITVQPNDEVEFVDSFLFNAHTSAIRCLAISPPSAPVPGQTQKVMLATGSTDERVNIYNLSAHPPSKKAQELMAPIGPRPILENPKNRELGTLLHHASTVTKLSFPTRSKLISSSEDSTIAITRTRDWSLLSSIKAPVPRAKGRPSGDTAAFGATPSGINDFAIDPSTMVMISVSKGERCMRLWNLVTGKKGNVLNFGRGLLQQVGEGKHSTGEARRVVWGSAGSELEFAVGFDRDIAIFSMEDPDEPKWKCCVLGGIRTKVHHICYIAAKGQMDPAILAVSTEDGRILFFSTETEHLEMPGSGETEKQLPVAKLVGQLGGVEDGVSGRIKDFTVVRTGDEESKRVFVIGGSSDGRLRIWSLNLEELSSSANGPAKKTVGKLLGTCDTQNRITCVGAFVMIPRPDGAESEEELESEEENSDSDPDSE